MKSFNITRITFTILLCLLSFSCSTDPNNSHNRVSNNDIYDKIIVGDSRTNIINLLGSPSNPDTDIAPDLKNKISNSLQYTDNKNSKYFSIWQRSDDLIYIVGFSEDDKVKVKHQILMLDK